MSAEGRGKVRYVGAMCIAKLKFHLRKSVISNLYNIKAKLTVQKAHKKLSLLESIEEQYHVLVENSEDIQSLAATQQKQNARNSLLNITDKAAQFFLLLTNMLSHQLTLQGLKVHSSDLLNVVCRQVSEDQSLYKLWCDMLKQESDDEYDASTLDLYMRDMYTDVTMRFIRVCAKQFRKDIKDVLKIGKKEAHRKEIVSIHAQRKTHPSNMKFNDVLVGNEQEKEKSHISMKLAVLNNKKFFMTRDFNKSALITLCRAYNLNLQLGKLKKEELNDILVKAISKETAMPNPSVFHQAATNENPAQGQKKGKGKGNGKSSAKATHCKICKEVESSKQDLEWIQCDSCDCWMHRICGGITDDDDWVKISQDVNSTWTCPLC
jgi:transcriptional regulator